MVYFAGIRGCMNEVLDIEKPEFVIFTGDVVVSNESFKGLDIVLDVCKCVSLCFFIHHFFHNHLFPFFPVPDRERFASVPAGSLSAR